MKFINYKDGSLFLDEKEITDPLDEQIQIEIHFAGINRADILQKNGHYPPPSGESEIIGLECSGIVTKLGKSVKNFSLGEQVCAILGGGGYAEYVNVNEKQVMPLPKNLNLHEAGCLPETTLTVFENIFNVSKFQRDEAILIHGGSSGIGTTAISILKNYTKNIFVTAGTSGKCKSCIELGATDAINYKDTDFEEYFNEKKLKVDVILDMVGGDYFQKNIQLMATEGRLVQIAIQQGYRTELDLRNLLMKRIYLTGSTLRPRTVNQKAEIALELEQKVWPLLGSGKIKPVIHSTFPLSKASDAHQLMEEGSHIGKILLIPKT